MRTKIFNRGNQTKTDKPEDVWISSKSRHIVQSMFTSISPTYDLLNHALSLNIDKSWRRNLAGKTLESDVLRILDVCGGTGDLGLSLANEAYKRNWTPQIYCSDFTPAMTVIAKHKFEKSTAKSTLQPVALVADTINLPFADNTFDLVTVAFGIRNVVDPVAGLQEMVRVCKPGSQVAVLEFSKATNPIINKAFGLYFSRILPAIGSAVTGTRAYSYLFKSVAGFPDGKEFSAMLSSATGTQTISHKLSFGIATIYLSRKRSENTLGE